jgi:hypothetical protein
MIDMTLLPDRFRKGWIAVCACYEGTAMHIRSTLQPGDILYPVAPAQSMTCLPTEEGMIAASRYMEDWSRKNMLRVGIDVMVEELYPDIWDDWKFTWT